MATTAAIKPEETVLKEAAPSMTLGVASVVGFGPLLVVKVVSGVVRAVPSGVVVVSGVCGTKEVTVAVPESKVVGTNKPPVEPAAAEHSEHGTTTVVVTPLETVVCVLDIAL